MPATRVKKPAGTAGGKTAKAAKVGSENQEEGPQVKRSSSPPHGAPKKRTAFIDITNVSKSDGTGIYWDLMGSTGTDWDLMGSTGTDWGRLGSTGTDWGRLGTLAVPQSAWRPSGFPEIRLMFTPVFCVSDCFWMLSCGSLMWPAGSRVNGCPPPSSTFYLVSHRSLSLRVCGTPSWTRGPPTRSRSAFQGGRRTRPRTRSRRAPSRGPPGPGAT
ncbi:unnamed protein product [Tetraodon nigroviridis]|uniref:(spotted green pufferfish) hypothetical protein n=1 Tax=Tetraodon nigroviridis TaxID=99883 RepID=Q4RH72_TETNG|nr:unnamed protein product [Tetraodon nigroviridis]